MVGKPMHVGGGVYGRAHGMGQRGMGVGERNIMCLKKRLKKSSV